MRAVCQSRLTWECRHRHPLRVSTVPSDDVAPCRGAGALVAYRNSAAGRCCEHNGDQVDFIPREGSTPCPVREVRRSACRLSVRTARPFRSGHSVDITRGGDVHKNPGPRRMATSIFGGLTLQASRP
ncbi:hypothetical protein TcG_10368 [Trypanosoma cruzi]|nr:hypothetical protein TcG_10368 [Trypanosoma cruzi]